MTIITTAASALTLANLVTRIRDMIGDPSSTATNQRFSDTQIRRFIDMQLAQMWVELTEDPSGFLESVSLSYTAGAERTALPSGFEGQSIYKVEDITDSSSPVFLDYFAQLDVDHFPTKLGWTLEGLNIVLRPKNESGTTLRIWRVKNFPRTIDGATSDQHSLPVDHEELICLGAASRLLQIDDELTSAQQLQLDTLWGLFRRAAARYRGPVFVRNVRRFA